MAVVKKSIEVLVVDDSAFMRKIIKDILDSDSEIKVVSTARNATEALEKIKYVKPDVITLDVEMPGMDGLSCLKEISKIVDTPVIMLSGLTQEGADLTIKALEYGAIDFITKPVNLFSLSGEDKKKEIIEKIKVAYRTTIKEIEAPKIEKKSCIISKQIEIKPQTNKTPFISETMKKTEGMNIVAIGTSTGGPRALQSVIPLIPKNVPAAFLIVQHMPPNFTKSLAQRLDDMSQIKVKEAENGETVVAGTAYIAPGDYHMRLLKQKPGSYIIKLDQGPPEGGHRPAVNALMKSISQTGIKGNLIGVIMTGMGSDGSDGLKMLKDINGAFTIAQDEMSCVVYGMPKSAFSIGAVDVVTPLSNISNEILKRMEVR